MAAGGGGPSGFGAGFASAEVDGARRSSGPAPKARAGPRRKAASAPARTNLWKGIRRNLTERSAPAPLRGSPPGAHQGQGGPDGCTGVAARPARGHVLPEVAAEELVAAAARLGPLEHGP